ncbi:MAG TPA: ATP-binding protein, partial [Euryarchaeota archaeon]|nr:ATP-binding protein [Euryarchaeota archaeon]
ELFPIKIKCSRNQIQQVLFNIIVNACQAMDNGGELHILCRAEEGRLLISFRDTGRGISEENIEEIFNPFFTTKGTGGTGLGLAVAMSIVKRHGGDILVDSEIGKGTTFTVIILNV